MTGIISIYRFIGDKAYLVKKIRLDASKDDLLAALAATREGLPSDHGAGMMDTRGNKIRPGK
jgi:hypothetical protein